MDVDKMRALFYCLQFSRELIAEIPRVIDMAESGRVLGISRAELKALVSAALESDAPAARFDISEHGFTVRAARMTS